MKLWFRKWKELRRDQKELDQLFFWSLVSPFIIEWVVYFAVAVTIAVKFRSAIWSKIMAFLT